MYQEATLPLFPMLPAAGRPAPDAEALRRRAGVDYFDLLVREILNKSNPGTAARLPFDWTINPYRGCEFGCVYCYARSTHGFFESTSPDDFETRIFVKRNAAENLDGDITLGEAPPQPARRKYRLTHNAAPAPDRCSPPSTRDRGSRGRTGPAPSRRLPGSLTGSISTPGSFRRTS